MTHPSDVEIDDDIANRLSALLAELLESERHSIAGADDVRREELRLFIEMREAELGDHGELDTLFGKYIAALPEAERPKSQLGRSQLHVEWHQSLERELAGWKDELAELEKRPVDTQALFDSARSKTMHLLRRAAENAELLPDLQNASGATLIFNPFLDEQDDQIVFAPQNQIANGEPKRFYIRSVRNGISAECDVYSRNRIVVLAGSTATKRESKGHPNYENQKERLIADGVLVDDGQRYKFAEDHEVTSPSAAGAIVLATPVNGRQNLKDASGIPFAQYYPK